MVPQPSRNDLQFAFDEQMRILSILRNGTLYIPDRDGNNNVPAIIAEHARKAHETLRQLVAMRPPQPSGYLL